MWDICSWGCLALASFPLGASPLMTVMSLLFLRSRSTRLCSNRVACRMSRLCFLFFLHIFISFLLVLWHLHLRQKWISRFFLVAGVSGGLLLSEAHHRGGTLIDWHDCFLFLLSSEAWVPRVWQDYVVPIATVCRDAAQGTF